MVSEAGMCKLIDFGMSVRVPTSGMAVSSISRPRVARVWPCVLIRFMPLLLLSLPAGPTPLAAPRQAVLPLPRGGGVRTPQPSNTIIISSISAAGG